jgi:predicted GNAT superfamily acetyltransferase
LDPPVIANRPLDPDLVDEAEAGVLELTRRQRLDIVELDSIDQHRGAADLLRRIWRADSEDQVMTASMIRALAVAGSYVVGAYRDGRLVGAAIAFLGQGHLHSHITGIETGGQGSGLGYVLKQHQRAWALRHGIGLVCWTFDPLVRRNAYFNLQKLGALPTEYLPDFYGPMTDGINAGDATDRLYVSWDLASPRSIAAARGEPSTVDLAALRAAGAGAALDRVGEEPVAAPIEAPVALVAVPPDVEGLRSRDQALAGRWRYAVREALQGLLGKEYQITGMAREGYYVMERAGGMA